MDILLNSEYWLKEKIKTEIELSEIVNGDLSRVKSAKTDEDVTTLQDIDNIMKSKIKYISYCKDRYEEELRKESQVQEKKSILYFDREYGY